MAIYVVFSTPRGASSLELISDKLQACYGAMRFFNDGLFSPSSVEIWLDATSEALGGALLTTIEISNLYADINSVYDYLLKLKASDRLRSIVLFRGIWEIGQIRLAGYFSVQNGSDWAGVYGDIEISAYSKGDIQDIVDALWKMEEVNGVLSSFVREFYSSVQNLRLKLSRIIFCRGLWSVEDPSCLMAIYLAGGRRNLLSLFYDSLREKKDSAVISKARPLNTKFLLDVLEENDLARERIADNLKLSSVAELPTNSVLYVAKENDSFGKLFEATSRTVIRPALKKLPPEEDVRGKIAEGLSEYRENSDQ
jgi:hypothetical protein